MKLAEEESNTRAETEKTWSAKKKESMKAEVARFKIRIMNDLRMRLLHIVAFVNEVNLKNATAFWMTTTNPKIALNK